METRMRRWVGGESGPKKSEQSAAVIKLVTQRHQCQDPYNNIRELSGTGTRIDTAVP